MVQNQGKDTKTVVDMARGGQSRAQTNLENLEKTVFFVTLRENLENSGNFKKIFQIPGKLREFF